MYIWTTKEYDKQTYCSLKSFKIIVEKVYIWATKEYDKQTYCSLKSFKIIVDKSVYLDNKRI